MKQVFLSLFSFFLFTLLHTDGQAQMIASAPTPVYEFAFHMELKNGELSLECFEGCYWKKLTFELEKGENYYLNQHGLSPEKMDEKKGFELLVKRPDKDLYNLSPIKGMAWKTLPVTEVKKQILNINHASITIEEKD